jgi:hypothetical protein
MVFVLLVSAVGLATVSVPVFAGAPNIDAQKNAICSKTMTFTDPRNGQSQTFTPNNNCPAQSYTVSAVVPPPRPNRAPVITTPSNGQTFTTNPVKVQGTCGTANLIKVFTNGVLIGSVICSADGHFSIDVDLVIGRNDLTAVPYNTLDQPGPSSATVSVTLNEPAGGAGFSTELLLQSENYFRGTVPGQEISWPITIVGGEAPYAVSIDWGDGNTDVLTRLAPGGFTVKHTYNKTGTGYLNTFPLIIRASDAAGHNAYLQLTTIVNPATGTMSNSGTIVPKGSLLVLWPLLIVLILLVLSFWLGERREKHILRKQLAALA